MSDVKLDQDLPAILELALPFSEANLLKGLTPQKAHADEVTDFSPHEMGE